MSTFSEDEIQTKSKSGRDSGTDYTLPELSIALCTNWNCLTSYLPILSKALLLKPLLKFETIETLGFIMIEFLCINIDTAKWYKGVRWWKEEKTLNIARSSEVTHIGL